MQYHIRNFDSSITKVILQFRDLIREGIRWKIGNGKTINFWKDNWIRDRPLVEFCQNPLLLYDSMTIEQFFTLSHTWDIDCLSQVLQVHLIACIKAIPIASCVVPDILVRGLLFWSFFPMKSACRLGHGILPSSK